MKREAFIFVTTNFKTIRENAQQIHVPAKKKVPNLPDGDILAKEHISLSALRSNICVLAKIKKKESFFFILDYR